MVQISQKVFLIFTARVRSTREGNVLTSVCPSIHPSVCPQGGYPYPIMLCNISQNAMRQRRGGTQTPPPPRGGTRLRYPPGGYPAQVPPGGGYLSRVPPPPPGGVPGPPPGGVPGPGTPGGVPEPGTPPGVPGPPPGGGGVGGYPAQVPPPTRVGQQKEYSLHGGRYASCVHAGGLSCALLFSSNQLNYTNFLIQNSKSSNEFGQDHLRKTRSGLHIHSLWRRLNVSKKGNVDVALRASPHYYVIKRANEVRKSCVLGKYHKSTKGDKIITFF